MRGGGSLFERLSGTTRISRYAPLASSAVGTETPGSKHAGGHRIRVTPVPIPNTEVKPDTADGTAWETVWESRSLPAVNTRKLDARNRIGLFLVRKCDLLFQESACGRGERAKRVEPRERGPRALDDVVFSPPRR